MAQQSAFPVERPCPRKFRPSDSTFQAETARLIEGRRALEAFEISLDPSAFSIAEKRLSRPDRYALAYSQAPDVLSACSNA
jgi:hypothetical protein